MSRVTLGEVCREYKGRAEAAEGLPVVGLEHLSQSDIDLVGCSHEATTFTKAFRKGHVLFGRRRAYLKKASLAPFDGVCSGDIIVIEAIEGRLLPRLLPFVIQNDYLFDFAVENSAGSLSPRVKWKDLSRFEFELPSMEKQRELADLLWAAQETKRAYSRLVSACDEIVKSRFVEMFGRDADCECARLSEVCSFKSGTTLPKDAEHESGELLYAKVADMNLPGNEKYITTSRSFVSRLDAGSTTLPPGTVVFPKRGGAIGTNKKRILIQECCVDLNTMGVIPGERVLTEYLFEYFQLIDLSSISNGSTIPQINNKDLSPLRIKVPDIELQQAFADFFVQVDKSEFALKQAIEGVSATMAAILNQELGMSDVQ